MTHWTCQSPVHYTHWARLDYALKQWIETCGMDQRWVWVLHYKGKRVWEVHASTSLEAVAGDAEEHIAKEAGKA